MFCCRLVDKKRFLSKSLILTSILSLIISINLGINYTISLTRSEDGIAINNWISGIIIGNESWSYDLFKSYFNYSVAANLLNLFFLIISILVEKKFFYPNE